jgi:hypothetical protein
MLACAEHQSDRAHGPNHYRGQGCCAEEAKEPSIRPSRAAFSGHLTGPAHAHRSLFFEAMMLLRRAEAEIRSALVRSMRVSDGAIRGLSHTWPKPRTARWRCRHIGTKSTSRLRPQTI